MAFGSNSEARPCGTCKGAKVVTRPVVVKGGATEERKLSCPACGGTGKGGLRTK